MISHPSRRARRFSAAEPAASGRLSPVSVAGPGRTVVVGGGIAGLAAATVLAERGHRVTVLERETFLGGRAGAWPDRLRDGTSFQMERGFHAFFRQYYNLRQLLKRVDPELRNLSAAADYPILTPTGDESFAGLTHAPLVNVAKLAWRTDTLRLADLARVNVPAAFEMLRFDARDTYARFDGCTAREYLDSLNFPAIARQRLLHVFAHSCFNSQDTMSAAELLQMFHFYFTANPEGLVFDVATRPFSTAFFEPLGEFLVARRGEVRTGVSVQGLERTDSGWVIETDEGTCTAEGVVLATDVPALKAIVSRSATLDDPGWRASIKTLAVAEPFAVWRLWLDRPVSKARAGFAGTAGVGRLDNISVYDVLEDESRAWAQRTGGSVIELHAYALSGSPDPESLKTEMLAGLHRLYPETEAAIFADERFLLRQDCPAFAAGSRALRPGVATPFPGLVLAGDALKLPFPAALMERAAATGILAANCLLAETGEAPEPLWSVASRGPFSRTAA